MAEKENITQQSAAADETAELEMLSRNIFSKIQQKSKQKLHRKMFFYITILVIFCACLAAVLFSVFFKIKHITVSGSTIYDDWRIIEASGITAGNNAYAVSRSAAEKRITEKFPYVRSVSLSHPSPSTLQLSITEDSAEYFFVIDGEYFILSDSLRVLEIISDSDIMQTRHADLLEISVSGVSKAVVGSRLEFVSSIYYDYAVRTLRIFAECSMAPHITLVNCCSKFDVYFIYDGRFRIEVGDTDDLQMKLTFADAVIKDLSDGATGIINVENQNAFFIAQSTIE